MACYCKKHYSKICVQCGKSYEMCLYKLKTKKFCSRSCYWLFMKGKDPCHLPDLKGKPSWNKGKELSDAHKKRLSESHNGIMCGPKHPKWKGGVTTFDKLARHKFAQTIRKDVLKRDNYTCQSCGIRGVDLQVDHIQPWAEYLELRFCIDNCRTLCAKCHYKITFGKPMPPTITNWGRNLNEAYK